MTQKEKTKFRQSIEWKKFRKQLKQQQKVDPLTLKPLSTHCHCHHYILNPDRYTDISDVQKFVMYNKKTHDTIHFLYNIVTRRGLEATIQAITQQLYTMLLLNHIPEVPCA